MNAGFGAGTPRDPLDARWYVRVGTDIYGPYSGHQMRGYVAEGRITAQSMIALEGARDWTAAANDQILGPYVAASTAFQRVEAKPAHVEAAALSSPVTAERPAATADHQLCNFVIIFPNGARATTRLEQTIMNLGPACKLSSTVWIVSAKETAASVRNMLTEFFGKNDSLLVVDATRGKAAWFNFGPEQESRIRRVWQRGDRHAA